MVKLRAIEPFAFKGSETAYCFVHPASELSLEQWLNTYSGPSARLDALELLLSDDALYATCCAPKQQQALRIATEVMRAIMLLCRDREKSVMEMVEELMHNSPPNAGQ